MFEKNIQIKVVVIILFLFLLIYLSNFLQKYKNHHNDSFYFYENFDSKTVAFEKAMNFIKSCISSKIFKNQQSFLTEAPYISVIIPMFNCENYILRSVKSAQYQNISNIEIILVDDKSIDNTISIVEKIQNEDQRIKIIKNQKNMGILYSRSIGVLSSKGKYIFTLDNDDIFLDKDILDIISKIADKGTFDIVEFKAISNNILNEDLLNNTILDSEYSHQKSFTLYQPELGRFPIPNANIQSGYILQDIFLWGKCIRAKIYQEALNKFGYNRYSRYMICAEDILINYIICNTAKSFIFVEKYGIYHLIRFGSGAKIGFQKVSRNTNILYLIDAMIDFSQNNIVNKKVEVDLMIYLLNLKLIITTFKLNHYYIDLIISCIRRILNSKYISENDKDEIKNISKSLKLLNFSNSNENS